MKNNSYFENSDLDESISSSAKAHKVLGLPTKTGELYLAGDIYRQNINLMEKADNVNDELTLTLAAKALIDLAGPEFETLKAKIDTTLERLRSKIINSLSAELPQIRRDLTGGEGFRIEEAPDLFTKPITDQPKSE
jgi:hypothetical protein